MPPKIETITVRVRCRQNGGFSVSVENWNRKIKKAQNAEIEWELKAEVEQGNDTARVKWMRVENPFDAALWPFQATPPDPTYIAYPNQNAKSGPIKAGWVITNPPTPTRYSLTICFADDSGGSERYAYIDPDMVIET
jgi:hypothetical protein